MYNQRHLHFIGIGGVGMAGIAEVLRNLGYPVSGSDVKSSALTDHLASLGAQISIGHREQNIPEQTAVVVVSSAIEATNVELVCARARGIPVIPRAEMLAELMRMKYGIAIAGSHGKTTTTTMTAQVLADTGFDPTVIIGGKVRKQRSGARMGTGKYLVAEADESDGSFCLLRPAIAVITNIDIEHLNHYGSFGKLEEAFHQFMSSVPFYGLVIACGDDPIVKKLAGTLHRRVVYYGLTPGNDLTATDIVQEGGCSTFTLKLKGETWGRCSLAMPGIHMVSNSLAAIAVGLELGASVETVTASLVQFAGVARRSEVVGEPNGVLIIDDYGHHPTEIAATITAIKHSYLTKRRAEFGERCKLVTVFQPHRYTRTRDLFSEFVGAFTEVDRLFLTEIYSAGEEEIPGISGEKLAQSVQHADVTFIRQPTDCLDLLVTSLKPGDVVLTLGAGSIGNLAHQLNEKMELLSESKIKGNQR